MSATAALSSYPVTYPADPVGLDDLDLDLEAEEARSWDASTTTTTTDEGTSTEEEDAEVSAESELGALVGMRRRILGPNLSLLYNEPIHLVRGSGCYLVDRQNKRYLDAVNNVPIVGHSEPRVAEAVSEAMRTLNTNIRYIREDYLDYAEELLAMFPAGLDTVYFCNSGSEANDLALRIAREVGHAEARRDVVVMDGAYHGHTEACIEISPYKFNRAGGKGKPETTHVMPLPDTCRGKGLDGGAEAEKILEASRRAGRPAPCAFICESLLSCGGQVILPPGYLKGVYGAMRRVGAVCIADEVQCGFGRTGAHFWGFQTQGVVPDIVILGKSIGNGFPLSAVVLRRELAEKFSSGGMEYFNTFGGCNAAVAAGHAVLRVIKQDRLQENARVVGKHILESLRALARDFDVIGDVRGIGLFAGIEFVTSKSTLLHAPSVAKFVCNSCKDRLVLVSTDGMHSNVIKIKPPVCFSMEEADVLVSTIRAALTEVSYTISLSLSCPGVLGADHLSPPQDLTEDILPGLLQADLDYNLKFQRERTQQRAMTVSLSRGQAQIVGFCAATAIMAGALAYSSWRSKS